MSRGRPDTIKEFLLQIVDVETPLSVNEITAQLRTMEDYKGKAQANYISSKMRRYYERGLVDRYGEGSRSVPYCYLKAGVVPTFPDPPPSASTEG